MEDERSEIKDRIAEENVFSPDELASYENMAHQTHPQVAAAALGKLTMDEARFRNLTAEAERKHKLAAAAIIENNFLVKCFLTGLTTGGVGVFIMGVMSENNGTSIFGGSAACTFGAIRYLYGRETARQIAADSIEVTQNDLRANILSRLIVRWHDAHNLEQGGQT